MKHSYQHRHALTVRSLRKILILLLYLVLTQQGKNSERGFANPPALPLCTRAVLWSLLCKLLLLELVLVLVLELVLELRPQADALLLSHAQKGVGWRHLLSLLGQGHLEGQGRLPRVSSKGALSPGMQTPPLFWALSQHFTTILGVFLHLLGIFLAAPHAIASCPIPGHSDQLCLLCSPSMRQSKSRVRLPEPSSLQADQTQLSPGLQVDSLQVVKTSLQTGPASPGPHCKICNLPC